MKERKRNHILVCAVLLLAVTLAALLALPGGKRRGRRGPTSNYLPAPVVTAEAAEVSSWTQAVRLVKEDRGEPVGKQAEVLIPHQLRHYSDTRRFLATQVAEWREHGFETPKDYVDLAAMIGRGEMVPLRQVGQNYILFGVGGQADRGPFTRYQKGRSVALYGGPELTREYARLAASLPNLKEKELKAGREALELLDENYGDAERRAALARDYESLEALAKSFPDRDYDLSDGRARQELKVRLLGSLRPEAFKVLQEVAKGYKEKFGRPLPVTSLVRPDEYQHALSRVNPNATLIETPPHSTGLAFDINYRYMTAEEQTFVMGILAQFKDAGRIEVLRENRDHYHVFAFVDGKRPDEDLIRASLGKIGGGAVAKETKRAEEVTAKEPKKKPAKRAAPERKKTARGRRR